MIAWSRLLGGGVRDPLVGGHLLIGVAFGVGLAVCVLRQFASIGEQSGGPRCLDLHLDFIAGRPAHDRCPR